MTSKKASEIFGASRAVTVIQSSAHSIRGNPNSDQPRGIAYHLILGSPSLSPSVDEAVFGELSFGLSVLTET